MRPAMRKFFNEKIIRKSTCLVYWPWPWPVTLRHRPKVNEGNAEKSSLDLPYA